MKKLLYGTTALVAVALVAGSASAEEKIKLGLGGYWNAQIAVGDNDNDASPSTVSVRSHGISHESEIYFTGSTTLDNGITFGVVMQLEGETSGDQMDNNYIYAKGDFGTIQFGEQWGPGLMMAQGTVGGMLAGHGDFASHTHITALNGLGLNTFSGDAGFISRPVDKLIYYTPRISGMQLGVAYMPDNQGANNDSAAALASDIGGTAHNEMLDANVNYVSKFGATSIGVSAGYTTTSQEQTAVGGTTNEDADATTFGVSVGFAGIKLGGRITQINNIGGAASGAELDKEGWRFGAQYKMGSHMTLGAEYINMEQDVTATTQDETVYWSMGVSYHMGPGIMTYAGIQMFDFEDATNAAASEGENTIGVMGLKLSF